MSLLAKDVNRCLIAMQNGDISKYDELFGLTYNHLRKVSYFYLKNRSNVDDVLSDTFTKVYLYYKAYKRGQDGYNWMCKIVEHVAIDYNIKDSKIQTVDDSSVSIADPNDEISAVEDRVVVDDIFKSLDETNKTIAYRRFYFGESLEEIGRHIGMSKVGVFKRLRNIGKVIEEKSQD